MFDRKALDTDVERRIEESRGEREKSRKAIASGHPLQAEEDVGRRRAYVRRMGKVFRPASRGPVASRSAVPGGPPVPTASELDGAETTQGETIDFVDAAFLLIGQRAMRAVAHVVGDDGRTPLGTGFMISPTLFITNHHVLMDEEAAAGAKVAFDYELDENFKPRATTLFALDPQTLFYSVSFKTLDFSIIAVGKRTNGDRDLASYGFCRLSDRPDKHSKGISVNIVQHPNGWFKKLVLRENRIVARGKFAMHYEADTEHGSSGSPVFNDAWEVVALHHWGKPNLEVRMIDGTPVPVTVNEGVRISSIVANLRDEAPQRLPAAKAQLIAEAIADRTDAEAARPAVSADDIGNTPEPIGSTMPANTPSGSGSATLVVPLEVTFRILSSEVTAQRPAIADKVVSPIGEVVGPERVRIDRNYRNRKGYDSAFLPGFQIALPAVRDSDEAQIAPLVQGTVSREAGLLDYQHFSVLVHKRRKMAFFTATNIDGSTYVTIDRDTGLPADAEASETWFDDDRMDADFYLGQDFYSANSNFFDRGHLTRRTDPTWGTEARAVRANADTFHRTNCSPQHFRFNQSTRFWQGVERHYLEFGATLDRSRLTVFQGPVMDDRRDRDFDGVKVPLQFWKIVVRVTNGELKATGFLVNQEPLLEEERRGVRRPVEGEAPRVDQFLAPITKIEGMTGLNFGTLRDHDTFRRHPGPDGAEAADVKVITDWKDLD